MRSMTPTVAALAAVAAVAFAALPAEDGVALSIVGKAELPVDRIELDIVVRATAELGGDAIVDLDAKRKRAESALADSGIEGLSVTSRGRDFRVSAAGEQNDRFARGGVVMINGVVQGADEAQAGVTVTDRLTVAIDGVAQLDAEARAEITAILLDVLNDAEIAVDPNASTGRTDPWGRPISSGLPLRVVSAANDAAEAEAVADGIRRARAQAASLLGAEPGRIRSLVVSQIETVPEGGLGAEVRASLNLHFALR